jgi:hypothetical protein
VKSFLRTYAEKLGLDAHLLVEEFRAKYEEPEPVEFQPLASPPRDARRRPPAPRFGPGVAIGAVVVALLAFLLILGLTGGEDEPEQTVDTGPDRAQPRERKPAAPQPAEQVELRVIPAFPTYVCVDRGADEVVFEGTIDSPQTYRGRDMLRINLGKRSAQLRLNGEQVAFETNSPEPIGFEFARNGSRRQLPDGERPCA